MGPSTPEDLQPTWFIDSGSAAVRDFVARVTDGAEDEHDVVARLFAAVRDGIRYDPYAVSGDPDDYRASAVLGSDSNDALLHPFTGDGSQYMEYVRERGVYRDLPLSEMLASFRETYGEGQSRPQRNGDG